MNSGEVEDDEETGEMEVDEGSGINEEVENKDGERLKSAALKVCEDVLRPPD